jgi:hypothetical protein
LTIRADDAERNHTVGVLRAHLLDDRLTIEEFAERSLAAYGADTHEELDGILADLPPLTTRTSRDPQAHRGRHGESELPAVGWRPTRERFRDPSTNRVMRVWVNPADASRHYVAE